MNTSILSSYTILLFLFISCNNQQTLVLITADHETGGYGITGQNKSTKQLETGFLNDDHTATMVPLFAFGPGAEDFIGTYDNTDLYHKILAAYK
jgi:alkaline phosphatase|tara:strand:- start:640 stop:921 length:282 start_codon:yes stop_codon:yes gene_type:complete